jgi:integrase
MAKARSKYINQMILDNGIRPPKAGETTYRVKHCAGLYLRVSATGAASWRVMYRVNGRQVKEVLGTVVKVPRLDEAVRRAQALQAQARAGVNPASLRRDTAARAAANTVEAAVERWLEACETGVGVRKKLRPKTIEGYRQIMRCDVLPRWRARPLASITKPEVEALLYEKAGTRMRPRKGTDGGALVQANRVRMRLGTFFAWCVKRDLLTVDPAATVIRAAEEASRSRVLDEHEIRALWAATERGGAFRANGVTWGALFRLLLLTAQRRSEVAGMRWSEVDLDQRIWSIPAARAKNNRAHVVHLSALALEELDQVPRRGELVFSGSGGMPASGFRRAKARLNVKMGVDDWVVHDLRRTAVSHMAGKLKVQPFVVDKVINHATGAISGVAAIYNRERYLDERQTALEAWGRWVAGLVGIGGGGNVVEDAARLSGTLQGAFNNVV